MFYVFISFQWETAESEFQEARRSVHVRWSQNELALKDRNKTAVNKMKMSEVLCSLPDFIETVLCITTVYRDENV